MNDIKRLHSQFTAISTAQQVKRNLDSDQFNDLVDFVGFRPIADAVHRARTGDNIALSQIVHWANLPLIASALISIDFTDINLQQIDAIAKSTTIDRIRKIIADAMNGDTAATAIIQKWLVQPPAAAPQGQSASMGASRPVRSVPVERVSGGAPSARTPAHPTSVPPPPEPTRDDPRTMTHQDARQSRPAASPHDSSIPPSRNGVRDAPQRDPQGERGDGRHVDQGSEPRTPALREREQERDWDQVVVYGRDRTGATALQFDCSPNPDNKFLTINISIARAKGARTQDGVDWPKKICLMLSPAECVLMLSVLMGYNRTFRGAGHGPANKIWFEATESEGDYAGGIFVTVAHGNDSRGCSIPPGDLMAVICIFQRAVLDQHKASTSKIEPLPIERILKRVAQMHDLSLQSAEARKSKKQARG